jgi:D-alanyl-D-alanine carboxypeptidase
VTKTFTAALILDLVDAGRLSLDDTLDKFYPAFASASAVRIRHLLSHSSGLFEYLGDPEVYAGRFSPWNPDDAIARAAAHPLRFAPGTWFEYCNTNYIVLGRIVERVTGETYGARLRTRLLAPLHLDDTFLEGFDAIPYAIVEGSVASPTGPVARDRIVHPSLSWAAGAIQSDAEDVARWFDALFGGHVLSPASLEGMKTPLRLPNGAIVPAAFGMGIETSPDGTHWFHSGGGEHWDFACYAGRAEEASGASVVACSSYGPVAGQEIARALWAAIEAP